MGEHHPELVTDRGRVGQVIANEEEQFSRTLQSGTIQIERLIAEARAENSTQ